MTSERAPHAQTRLVELAAWLAAYAPATGLLGYSSLEDISQSAIDPAHALRALVPCPHVGCWADIGAGAGSLGLALAVLCPAMHVTLVDRRDKATAFAELAARRLSIPNVDVLTADLDPSYCTPRFLGVCLRAMTETSTALSIAAGLANRYVCAWHAPGLQAYDESPVGFRTAGRTALVGPNLVATLYARG